MADNNRVIVELGRVIQDRGEWDDLPQDAKLYLQNIVQYNKSTYRVKAVPAVGYITKDVLPTDTTYYTVFAGVGEVATGSDFDTPSAAQRDKITTVGAVLDGMNDGVYNLTAKTGDSYATLSDALIAANNTIPTNKKRGGMSICFINSSDNMYVQYRYRSSSTAVADFTNIANWQSENADTEITSESKNMAESGAVAKKVMQLNGADIFTLNGFFNATSGNFVDNAGWKSTPKMKLYGKDINGYFSLPAVAGNGAAVFFKENGTYAGEYHLSTAQHGINTIPVSAFPVDAVYVAIATLAQNIGQSYVNYGVPISIVLNDIAKKETAEINARLTDLDSKPKAGSVKFINSGGVDSGIEDAINNIEETTGMPLVSGTLDSNDYCGLIWNGTKFIAATSSYNSFVIKVSKGQIFKYGIISGTGQQVRAFPVKPGLNVSTTQIGGYLAPNTEYTYNQTVYVFAQFNISQTSPSISYTLTSTGLFNDIKDINTSISNTNTSLVALSDYVGAEKCSETLDSSDLCGLLWDGTKFIASTSTYNAFSIKVAKGQVFKYSVISGEGRQVRAFPVKPELNVQTTQIGSYLNPNTNYTYEQDIYVFAQFNVSEVSPSINYTLTSTGLTKRVDDLGDTISPFAGKTIVFFGDSVVEGAGSVTGYSFPDYVRSFLNCTVINGGIGGTRYVPRNYERFYPSDMDRYYSYRAYHQLDILSLVQAAISGDWSAQEDAAIWLRDNAGDDNTAQVAALSNTDFSKVDSIVFSAASNDWSGESAMGVDSSTNDDDFCGVLNIIINGLLTAYPQLKIYFVTNAVRYYASVVPSDWCSVRQNGLDLTLEDYVNKNMDICKKWCIPYYDFFHKGGWNMANFTNYFVDIAHPGKGYDYMGHRIAGYLKSQWG